MIDINTPWRATSAPNAVESGNFTLCQVSVPSLEHGVLYDVCVEDGVFTDVRPTTLAAVDAGGVRELWPGYVECHAHIALPANFDDSLDEPAMVALQYLYHGVTHVVDMFGFPLVQAEWEAGRKQSVWPYPELVHCGYAVTAMRGTDGLTGHGTEFPAPVFMLGGHHDLDAILQANRMRGASFLKLMYTEGVEQPGGSRKFSCIQPQMLKKIAAMCSNQNVPCIADCNTREEVLQAYRSGIRLFAHPVRDVVLSNEDWLSLSGARFMSTLSGLRPMILGRNEFMLEYGRPSFAQTQDLNNVGFISSISEPFGIRFNCQASRSAAIRVMLANSQAALSRNALLPGTDCGNTGAFHGYSLIGELAMLLDEEDQAPSRLALMRAATVDARQFFESLTGSVDASAHPIREGAPASFNLFAPSVGDVTQLPTVTVVGGQIIDRDAVVQAIHARRDSSTRGKTAFA